MKIAIVYDRVNKFGGAEQVLLAMHEIWPEAPLFTAVYNPATAGWARVFTVHPSFMNRIPLARLHHEFFPWLTPVAFESFSFDAFDVVISVTSAEAKSIITKPSTIHLCYCLTPTRYLWSGYQTYQQRAGLGVFDALAKVTLARLIPHLRRWDYIAGQRPDAFVAISMHVKQRIEKYYQRKVGAVIYPPVDTNTYHIAKPTTASPPELSFLVVSRLVAYKRLDLLVQAFNQLGFRLTVVGNGRDLGYLRRLARKNISFVNRKLTDKELAEYYQECSAFVFAGQEDFGIVAAEAQACGKPVLCFADSGMAEIIQPGVTGELIPEQTVESIIEVVHTFISKRYAPDICRENSLRFDTIRFQKQLKTFVEGLL